MSRVEDGNNYDQGYAFTRCCKDQYGSHEIPGGSIPLFTGRSEYETSYRINTGLISAVISTVLVGAAFAGSSEGTAVFVADSNLLESGSGSPGAVTTPVDKHTDLTGGQPGIPNEYAGTPVQQGKLHEVTDSKWLQQPVYGKQGEIVGKIKQVFTDQKTGKIEYVILVPSESKTPIPLRWSQFEERNGQLQVEYEKGGPEDGVERAEHQGYVTGHSGAHEPNRRSEVPTESGS